MAKSGFSAIERPKSDRLLGRIFASVRPFDNIRVRSADINVHVRAMEEVPQQRFSCPLTDPRHQCDEANSVGEKPRG